MKEALSRVRAELGPEAVILASREVKKSRLLGLARSQWIEITAGTGLVLAEKQSAGEQPVAAQQLERLSEQVSALHHLVDDLCRRKKSPTPDLPAELAPTYVRLIENDVQESIASDLVCQLRDEMSRPELARGALVRHRLAELIQDRLHVSGPIVCESGRCKVVALVGPTGAGKTTTIAKLAANFKLRQKLRVGLVTLDTYRLAAVEQLRTYAEIIDLPLKVVGSPREMAAAVSELSNLDLVLLDTAGRSPRDELRVKELRSYLTEAGASEIHLVLSAVASRRSLMAAAERFLAIDVNRLLVTKLDEAATLGGILSCAAHTPSPLSYLCTGQDVPDNIQVADAPELAERIVEGVVPQAACEASFQPADLGQRADRLGNLPYGSLGATTAA
jgi:flagellar biosynthesis protein FlhF